MSLIKALKIRRMNKIKNKKQYQSKRTECCESCKYCYVSEFYNGYGYYKCFLNVSEFDNSEESVITFKCDNYKPCRKYKKYLENKI